MPERVVRTWDVLKLNESVILVKLKCCVVGEYIVIPNLVKIGCYSPNVYSLRFSFVLNPDCAICIYCCDCPSVTVKTTFCFAEDMLFAHQYLVTNFVIPFNPATVLAGSITVS